MRRARQTDNDPPASSSSALGEDPLLQPSTSKDRKGKQKAAFDEASGTGGSSSAASAASSSTRTARDPTPDRTGRDSAPDRHDADPPANEDEDDSASEGAPSEGIADAYDDEDLFHEELLPLHPTVAAFLAESPIYDRSLPDRLRKRLLRAFPPVADYSVRAPSADQSFAALAHPSTLRRDRQLVNVTILHLQAVRPLLLAWSELLDVQEPSQRERELIDALRTSVSLSLHAVATTTALRRKWILADVNPSLVRTLSAPTAPLFGHAITQRLQEADSVATTVRRLQRPNGQRTDQRNNGFNRSNNSSDRNNYSNNRYSGRNNAYGRDNRNFNSSNNYQRQRYNNNNNNNSDRNRNNSDGRTRDSQVSPGNHA